LFSNRLLFRQSSCNQGLIFEKIDYRGDYNGDYNGGDNAS